MSALPLEDPNGNCRGCGRAPDTTHVEDCMIMATLNWAGNVKIATGADSEQTANDRLTGWWMEVARGEAERVVPKAIEYGATDMIEIGRQMLAAGVEIEGNLTQAQYKARLAELGCYFYMVGKMARWTDAIADCRMVSDDTLLDIGVYVRTVQRIRAAGGWPGVEMDEMGKHG